MGLSLVALAVAMVASAAGVARVRAGGVLLGVGTSVGMLGAAMFSRDPGLGFVLALGAFPGLLLIAPILAARVSPPVAPAVTGMVPARFAGDASPSRVEAVDEEDEAPAVRTRVDELEDLVEDPPAHAPRASAGAAR